MLGLGIALGSAFNQIIETLFDAWSNIAEDWEDVNSKWENLG